MSRKNIRVCVVGLGYIGLPTAALIASRGATVIGVDIDKNVVDTIASGHIHIAEADLEGLVQKVVFSKKLLARDAPEPADVFMIAVPTPLSGNKKPVVDHVLAAAKSIAPHLAKGNLVILESTSPVGTTEQICDLLAELRPDLTFPGNDERRPDVFIAYCPERVLPGRILIELVQNDRCVGGMTPECAAKARDFYELFVCGKCIETSARTAEMVKLTENAFRDTNIAFANELSLICDHVGIDAWEVIQLANRHPRVDILKPGPGVGGHCIAVDPWFIVDAAPHQARLIRTSREVNDGKADYVFSRVRDLIESYPERRVACLGITFKANVDDLRESPALEIVERLAKACGPRIQVVEPFVEELPQELSRHGARKIELEEALDQSGILIVLVDHDAFRRVGATRRNGAIVYDTRGIWERTSPPPQVNRAPAAQLA
ncbi:MAG: UDP-N-acetyl-D-mannosamine dehydrogenase [Xanthobacteraceae bacterium]|nr:UDP-N-acetyl-D-mannosamine dehydrogenase [Xanthobacteraceae bacterium]MCW5678889.1 UDP-N-acetyl-D-mannosamine dehydrogenase [Xanthobacteraceae bacterium]